MTTEPTPTTVRSSRGVSGRALLAALGPALAAAVLPAAAAHASPPAPTADGQLAHPGGNP
jgi:hypothetical protein